MSGHVREISCGFLVFRLLFSEESCQGNDVYVDLLGTDRSSLRIRRPIGGHDVRESTEDTNDTQTEKGVKSLVGDDGCFSLVEVGEKGRSPTFE